MTHDELQRTVRTLVRRHARQGEPDRAFNRQLWHLIGDIGVFGLATPAGGGTVADLCRCIYELGAGGVVGPVVETIIAGSLDLGADAAGIAAGARIAVVTWRGDLVPWGTIADVVVLVDGGRAYTAVIEAAETIGTLAGDEWVAGRVSRGSEIGAADAAITLGEFAAAAYLVGAGVRIVELSAEYAGARRQFGRSIGDYQAVSHPLAEAFAGLAGLRDILLGTALAESDPADPETAERASRLRLAAVDTAVNASYIGFQTQGGMGFVAGTELAHLGTRIRQVSLTGIPQAQSVERATARLIA